MTVLYLWSLGGEDIHILIMNKFKQGMSVEICPVMR